MLPRSMHLARPTGRGRAAGSPRTRPTSGSLPVAAAATHRRLRVVPELGDRRARAGAAASSSSSRAAARGARHGALDASSRTSVVLARLDARGARLASEPQVRRDRAAAGTRPSREVGRATRRRSSSATPRSRSRGASRTCSISARSGSSGPACRSSSRRGSRGAGALDAERRGLRRASRPKGLAARDAHRDARTRAQRRSTERALRAAT